MTEAAFQNGADGEVSLYAVATALLRHRWRILTWMLIGGFVTAFIVWSRPALYVASASFVPQETDAGRAGLASLAGQFGVSLPSANQSLSPDFYSKLLKSRRLMLQVVRDTFVVPEMGGRRMPFFALFDIQGSDASREDEAVKLLADMVSAPTPARTTGIVEVSVATRWPSVSLAIASALVNGVNDYNQRTRKTQATAERQFLEGRLATVSADLRGAEDRMQHFLAANRQIGNSPELTFDRERIQRELLLRQQVFTSLTQAYEDARLREVRDTPVIAMVEVPTVSPRPLPRARGIRILLGMLLAGFIGALPALRTGMSSGKEMRGNPDADEFLGAFGEAKGEFLHPLRRLIGRSGS